MKDKLLLISTGIIISAVILLCVQLVGYSITTIPWSSAIINIVLGVFLLLEVIAFISNAKNFQSQSLRERIEAISKKSSDRRNTEGSGKARLKLSRVSIVLIALAVLIGIPIIVLLNAPYQVTCERYSSSGSSSSSTTVMQGFFDQNSADAMYNQRSSSGMSCSKNYRK